FTSYSVLKLLPQSGQACVRWRPCRVLWPFNSLAVRKVSGQWSQVKGLASECVTRCRFRCLEQRKVLGQRGHTWGRSRWWGFSPVCVRSWLATWVMLEKAFPQWVHMHSFGSVGDGSGFLPSSWVRMWLLRPSDLKKRRGQREQLNGFTPLCSRRCLLRDSGRVKR
ncbi:hypothetical protein GN956_G10395, partial [Arapaima gigas]